MLFTSERAIASSSPMRDFTFYPSRPPDSST